MPVSLGALASGIPFLLIGGKLLLVWTSPGFGNGVDWIRLGVSLAVMEFVLAHSGIFIGAKAIAVESKGKRIVSFFGIAAFYSLFAIAFSFISGGAEILQVFIFVMIGRFITIVSSSREERALLMKRAIIAAAAYFGLLFATSILWIPELGITREISRSIDWGNATGLWIRQPHRPIAMMAIYFVFLGIVEIFYFGTGIAKRSTWNLKRSRRRG